MAKGIKYHIGKKLGQICYHLMKIMPTGGQSFPGLVFLKFAGEESLYDLAKDQIKTGSILITGTNGKTTTTTMIIDLLSKDTKLTKSVGNNTINALTTGLLINSGDIGVFEYGIRDIKHGVPDTICRLVDPIGVTYTNISREHTQVAGVKNPFEDYIHAKTLLSKRMTGGILVTNADDPNTTYIGLNKEEDNHVTYYAFNLDSLNDIFEESPVKCPNCGDNLEYQKRYMNQRGIYSCKCGFKRPKPDIQVTQFVQNKEKWQITIEGTVYNYSIKDNVDINLTLEIPAFGIHNIYNILCSLTTYSSFTPKVENIEENATNYFNSLDFGILPPGRFEIFDYKDKVVGIGQGDNGDALKVNALLMQSYVDDEFEFIYTTPDTNEEEIFNDHKQTIKTLNPDKLLVIPGRISVDAANEYYEQIKDEYNSEFVPIEYDFETRINKTIELIDKSEYKYILISGCGEEIAVWEQIKNRLKGE